MGTLPTNCRDGQDAVNKLKYLREQLHRLCKNCNKDGSCLAEAAAPEDVKEHLAELIAAVDEYKKHKEIADHQDAQYRAQLQDLVVGEAVIVMDFSAKLPLPMSHEEVADDWWDMVCANDFVMTVFWRGSDGKLLHHFFDFVSDDSNNDPVYVLAAWIHLLRLPMMESFKTIHIWSDGGPKHFKARRGFRVLWEVGKECHKKLYWNFFASYHGKGPCDGHTGVGKSTLRREVRAGEEILKAQDIVDIYNKMKNTTAFNLQVDRDNDLECAKLTKGIKKYHRYEFFEDGKLNCFEKTGDKKFVTQMIIPLSHLTVPMDTGK